jgi:hypothetical protein
MFATLSTVIPTEQANSFTISTIGNRSLQAVLRAESNFGLQPRFPQHRTSESHYDVPGATTGAMQILRVLVTIQTCEVGISITIYCGRVSWTEDEASIDGAFQISTGSNQRLFVTIGGMECIRCTLVDRKCYVGS